MSEFIKTDLASTKVESYAYDDGTQSLLPLSGCHSWLSKIPQFQLPLPVFPVKQFLAELELLQQRIGFNGCRLDSGETHEAWQGLGIVVQGPHSGGLFGANSFAKAVDLYPELHPRAVEKKVKGDRIEWKDMESFKSEAWKMLPSLSTYAERYFSEDIFRSYVLKLKAGGGLGWHNHRVDSLEHKHSELLTVHIPVVTHPEIRVLVRNESGELDSKHYGLGESWVLNPLFDHAIDNRNSEVDRLHILMQFKIEGSRIVPVLDQKRRELGL